MEFGVWNSVAGMVLSLDGGGENVAPNHSQSMYR